MPSEIQVSPAELIGHVLAKHRVFLNMPTPGRVFAWCQEMGCLWNHDKDFVIVVKR